MAAAGILHEMPDCERSGEPLTPAGKDLMADDAASRISLVVIAVLAVLWSAHVAYPFLAPLTLAVFVLALAWPLHAALQARLPGIVAAILTLVLATGVLALLGWAAVWAFGTIWYDVAANAARYQSLYQQAAGWLEEHGIIVAALWADGVNVNWLLRLGQQAASRLSQTVSFAIVAVAYLLIGLVEVDRIRSRIEISGKSDTASKVISSCKTTARKLRTYIWVRTAVSLLTGVLFGIVAFLMGVPFAVEWSVIAFVLNYIPFIGSMIAAFLPSVFALAHVGDPWEALLVLAALTGVQFVGGNYLEPRMSGSALRLSPFVILASIFLWTFLWGVYGTFIAVPIAIAGISFAASANSTAWLAVLMGAADDEAARVERSAGSQPPIVDLGSRHE